MEATMLMAERAGRGGEMKEGRKEYEEELEKQNVLQHSLISGFMQYHAGQCIQRHCVTFQVAMKNIAREADETKRKGNKKSMQP
jgi:hypothetical protein